MVSPIAMWRSGPSDGYAGKVKLVCWEELLTNKTLRKLMKPRDLWFKAIARAEIR